MQKIGASIWHRPNFLLTREHPLRVEGLFHLRQLARLIPFDHGLNGRDTFESTADPVRMRLDNIAGFHESLFNIKLSSFIFVSRKLKHTGPECAFARLRARGKRLDAFGPTHMLEIVSLEASGWSDKYLLVVNAPASPYYKLTSCQTHVYMLNSLSSHTTNNFHMHCRLPRFNRAPSC